MISKDQIKTHYEKYKIVYHLVGTGLLVILTVLITRRIVRRNISVCDHLSGQRMDATTLVDNSGINVSSSIFKNSQVANTIINNSVERLSYIVHQEGTDNWWRSQSEAARELGISEPRISSHLNHGAPLENGIKLVREGVKASV